MSFSETIFLFFLALVIFGPKKLPEIARQAGKWLNEFKRASNEFRAQIEQEIAHLEVEKPTILPPAQSPDAVARSSRYASVELDQQNAPALAAPEAETAATPGHAAIDSASLDSAAADSHAAPDAANGADPVGAAAGSQSGSQSHSPESHG